MLKPMKTPPVSIVHKLLWVVFGLGVLLTILFSCIQTLAVYKARIADITQEMNGINNSLAPAISTALWGFDRQTLTSQAEGILHFNHISYVEVRGKGGFLISSGKKVAREPLIREFPLTHDYNNRPADLGSLYIEADTSKVVHAVLNDLKGIILFQILTVTIVSLFILLLFNRLVTRHIAGAAQYFRNFEVGDSASLLTLDKKRTGDEIDMLVDAFNALQEKLTLSHQKLAQSLIERDALLESLKKSESLLNQTQHLTKAGGWEYDVLAGKLTWTGEVYRIHGLAPEEYDPNDIDRGMGFYAPGDDSVIRQAFRRSVEEGVA